MIFDLSTFLANKDSTFHLEGELESRALAKEGNIRVIDPIKFIGIFSK